MEGYTKKICRTYQNQKLSQNRINNNNNGDNLNGNSSLKELKIKEMAFFLKKCKVYLDKITFENVVKILQDYKNGFINDDGIIQKIKNYLKNNSDLLNLFNNIIT
jgi:histone deacetylase complex regulatory component SIN3